MIEIGERMDAGRQTRALAERLGYAGLLPFAFGAIIVWIQPPQFSMGLIGSLMQWVLAYGAVILSFMGGAEWGSALQTGRYERMLTAVLWALIGWVAVVPGGVIPGFDPSMPMRFLILFVAFTGLIVSELVARQWAGWYARLRMKLSAGTISLLLLTIMGLVY